ncbi:MAG: hypothetical protein JW384_03861 [Nitrosomonadaceae bacterium]|nr:hypothetical protein [Nitrosomonadaceae bacterium]
MIEKVASHLTAPLALMFTTSISEAQAVVIALDVEHIANLGTLECFGGAATTAPP